MKGNFVSEFCICINLFDYFPLQPWFDEHLQWSRKNIGVSHVLRLIWRYEWVLRGSTCVAPTPTDGRSWLKSGKLERPVTENFATRRWSFINTNFRKYKTPIWTPCSFVLKIKREFVILFFPLLILRLISSKYNQYLAVLHLSWSNLKLKFPSEIDAFIDHVYLALFWN